MGNKDRINSKMEETRRCNQKNPESERTLLSSLLFAIESQKRTKRDRRESMEARSLSHSILCIFVERIKHIDKQYKKEDEKREKKRTEGS